MKTIKELLEAAMTEKQGTYIGVRFSGQTQKDIGRYVLDMNIPNPIDLEKLHSTVIYSRKNLPNLLPIGAIVPPWQGYFKGFDVWDTQDGKRALVMEYDCEPLRLRNADITETHGAVSDFPDYKVHLTLSYDIGTMDIPVLAEYTGKIEITEEYYEPLDLEWSKSK